MGQAWVELAERVVGELGHVHDGLEPGEVVLGEVAQVAGQDGDPVGAGLIEPAGAVEAGVEPDDVVSGRREDRCGQ